MLIFKSINKPIITISEQKYFSCFVILDLLIYLSLLYILLYTSVLYLFTRMKKVHKFCFEAPFAIAFIYNKNKKIKVFEDFAFMVPYDNVKSMCFERWKNGQTMSIFPISNPLMNRVLFVSISFAINRKHIKKKRIKVSYIDFNSEQ